MLTITTYDRVPQFAVGYVRDLRVRWACAEAGLDYAVDTVPIRGRTDEHLARQPFHQVPMLRDGDLSLFESGAIVLHLAERASALMPPGQRAQVTQWVIAALNSIEPAVTAWLQARIFDKNPDAEALAGQRMHARLAQMNAVLDGRDWLVGDSFSAADLMLADILRQVGDEDALTDHPALADFVARATDRPAFKTSLQAQLDHFAKADAARASARAAAGGA